jgi:hypothetical protein
MIRVSDRCRFIEALEDKGFYADEVVPPQGVAAQVQRFDDLGYRYRHDLHPAEGHTADRAARAAKKSTATSAGSTAPTAPCSSR